MKRIIFFLFCLISSFSAFSQLPTQTTPSRVFFGLTRQQWTVLDSPIVHPTLDSFYARHAGTEILRIQGGDTALWFYGGNRRWFRQMNVRDTASMLLPYLRKADTTNKWWSKTTRFVDTIYKVNDSTVGYTILGDAHTFEIKGGASGGGGGGSGTVTDIATNTGTGITGGPITTTGTLANDTTLLSTRAWRQKGIDSLSSLLALKLNITDTANKWWSKTTRFVDTMYRVNDSTVGYTILGLVHTFEIKGGASSGGGSTDTTVVKSPLFVDTTGAKDTIYLRYAYPLVIRASDSALTADSDTSIFTNVLDFPGVAGDGVTDCTDGINSAIAYAATTPKPIVYFPPGVYMVRSAYRDTAAVYKPAGIQLQSNITLMGAGIGRTVIKLAAPPVSSTFAAVAAPVTYTTNTSFNHIIWGTNVSNVILRDFSVNGNIANQINYNINPYLTPQDSTWTDSVETDGIKFWFGSNNRVINVRVDSVAGYGIGFFASPNSLVEKCIVTTSINGGVYYKRYSDDGLLTKSVITNNHADNVRIRSNNITVDKNVISYSKFNPNVAQANFAGVYVESDSNTNLMPPSIIGVRITNNNINNNSSFAVDVNDRDTTSYTGLGPSVLIDHNTLQYNSNAAVTVHGPMVTITNNHILENGANSAGVSDPVTLKQAGISATAFGLGMVVSNNFFRDTRGFQDYAIAGAAGDYPRLMQFTNNTMIGGVSLMQATSNLWDLTIFGNTFLANAAATTVADIMHRVNTDNLWFNPASQGADFFSGLGNGYVAMKYASNGEAGFVGQQGTGVTNHLGMLFDSKSRYCSGCGAGTTGREITIWDFQTSVAIGGWSTNGELFVGPSVSSYGARIKQPTTVLSTTLYGAEFKYISNGSTANSVQSGVLIDLAPGYSAAGTMIAANIENRVVGTGNVLGSEAVYRGNTALYARSSGANTTGVNAGALLFGLNARVNVGAINGATVLQFNGATGISIGSLNLALKNHASAIQVGLYAGIETTPTVDISAGAIITNGASTANIVDFRDGTNSVMRIVDGGFTGFGTTSPDRQFHLEVSDAATNAVTFGQRLSHITSGTAAVGFGVGQEDELENASGTNVVARTRATVFTDATNASEDADDITSLVRAGSLTEAFRITSTGSGRFSGGLFLGVLSNGAAGTDSVLVINNTEVKKVSASAVLTTIYTGDGTLTGNRTVTMSGNTLNFTGGNVGISTSGPDRKLDILDAAAAQLRLTHTDGSVYTDFQTDGNGVQNITPTGRYLSIPTGSTSNRGYVPNVIWNETDETATSGTGETDLYSYTTPATTLGTDGEWLEYSVEGLFNPSETVAGATMTIRAYWAGTEILEATSNSTTAASYVIRVRVIRTSSTNARVTAYILGPGISFSAVGTDRIPRITNITTTFSNTNIIKVTGQTTDGTQGVNVQAGDIKWFPQNLPGT